MAVINSEDIQSPPTAPPPSAPETNWFADNAPKPKVAATTAPPRLNKDVKKPGVAGAFQDVDPSKPVINQPGTGGDYQPALAQAGNAMFPVLPGAMEAAKGVKQAVGAKTGTEFAGGAHRALTGTLEAASPLIGEGLLNAPIKTLATVGGAMVTQDRVEAGLQKLGLPKEYAQVAGDLVGILAGAAAHQGVEALESLKKRVEPVLRQRAQEQAKPAETLVTPPSTPEIPVETRKPVETPLATAPVADQPVAKDGDPVPRLTGSNPEESGPKVETEGQSEPAAAEVASETRKAREEFLLQGVAKEMRDRNPPKDLIKDDTATHGWRQPYPGERTSLHAVSSKEAPQVSTPEKPKRFKSKKYAPATEPIAPVKRTETPPSKKKPKTLPGDPDEYERKYKDIQDKIDTSETDLEKQGINPVYLIHPDMKNSQWLGSEYKPMPKDLAELYRQRDTLQKDNDDNFAAGFDENLRDVIPDQEARRKLVNQITEIDVPPALRGSYRKDPSWTELARIIQHVLTFARRENEDKFDDSFAKIEGRLGGTAESPGIQLVLKDNPVGTRYPTAKVFDRAQEILRAALGDQAPEIPRPGKKVANKTIAEPEPIVPVKRTETPPSKKKPKKVPQEQEESEAKEPSNEDESIDIETGLSNKSLKRLKATLDIYKKYDKQTDDSVFKKAAEDNKAKPTKKTAPPPSKKNKPSPPAK